MPGSPSYMACCLFTVYVQWLAVCGVGHVDLKCVCVCVCVCVCMHACVRACAHPCYAMTIRVVGVQIPPESVDHISMC